ncbi:MAG: outer membrane protein transport protein [Prevotella sp.]|jgi:long-subunit fatty acid transport protein|nr:outer membrane protein transport protein [Prevotella sp.]
MKRITSLLVFALSIGAIYAQGEMDAYKFSRNDLTGTARSVSMGGAFGALGGDISGISINPAGIGVYKSSEIVATLNFENTRTKTNLNDGEMEESKFKFNFDNLAFVSSIPLNSDVAPFLNVGFSYNRLKNFDKKYQMRGANQNYSLADYMAFRASEGGYTDPDRDLFYAGKNSDDPFAKSDWLAVFGYTGYLIDYLGNGGYEVVSAFKDNTVNTNLFVEEKGSVNTYDFNLGTTFSDIISAGMTIAITDIDYRMYSRHSEWINNSNNNGFDLENWLKTQGTGWQIKTGVIVKPMQELRLGVSYHSPTWYNMTDYASASMNFDMTDFFDGSESDLKRVIQTGDAEKDYKFRSPDKWTFSLAGVIGNIAILSVDYELTNYKNNMKLFNKWGDPLANADYDPNNYIKQDFRNASTVRVGAEVRVTPQFSLRAGYAWMQNPLDKEFKDNDFEVMTVGSSSHYVLDGDLNNFTYGLGYKFSRNFYADVAFVMSSQKSDLYLFPKGFNLDDELMFESAKTSLKTNRTQGLLTLGYKF